MCRDDVFDVEGFNDCMRRPSAQRELDAIDGFLVAFNQCLETAIGEILRVAVNPLGGGARGGKHPEADALHTSTDENPSRDDHKRSL